MTRAELAFSALDRNKKGYISSKDLGKLTKKLTKDEVASLMSKLGEASKVLKYLPFAFKHPILSRH